MDDASSIYWVVALTIALALAGTYPFSDKNTHEWGVALIITLALVGMYSFFDKKSYEKALASAPPICLTLKSGEVVCGKQTKLREYEQSMFQSTFQPDVYSYWIKVEGRGEVEIPKSAVALVLPYKKGG
jgi:hypothetical protein